MNPNNPKGERLLLHNKDQIDGGSVRLPSLLDVLRPAHIVPKGAKRVVLNGTVRSYKKRNLPKKADKKTKDRIKQREWRKENRERACSNWMRYYWRNNERLKKAQLERYHMRKAHLGALPTSTDRATLDGRR